LPARVGEVTVLQAGVQPLGEPDQLIHAVVLQGGRRTDVSRGSQLARTALRS
jgi:hypothetical protein